MKTDQKILDERILKLLTITPEVVGQMLSVDEITPFYDENGEIKDKRKAKDLFSVVSGVINKSGNLAYSLLLMFNLFKFRIEGTGNARMRKDGTLDIFVDSRYLKNLHSRYYSRFLENLEAVGLIQIDHNYLPAIFSKGEKAFLKTITLSKEMVDICNKIKVNDHFQRKYLQKIYLGYRMINKSCKMLMEDWVAEQMDKTIQQLADTTPTLTDEERNQVGIVKTFRHKRNGRLFNGINNVNKVIRGKIVQHHQLVEVDAVTSQPAIIAAMGTLNDSDFYDLFNRFRMETGNQNNDVYFRQFTVAFSKVYNTAIIACGDFYQYLADRVGASRQEVKEIIFNIFYGTKFNGNNWVLKTVNDFLASEMDIAWGRLKSGNWTQRLRSLFALFAQWVESKIFIDPINDGYLKDRIFFTVHDCIYCEPAIVDWFKKRLEQVWSSFFPKAGQMRLKVV